MGANQSGETREGGLYATLTLGFYKETLDALRDKYIDNPQMLNKIADALIAKNSVRIYSSASKDEKYSKIESILFAAAEYKIMNKIDVEFSNAVGDIPIQKLNHLASMVKKAISVSKYYPSEEIKCLYLNAVNEKHYLALCYIANAINVNSEDVKICAITGGNPERLSV